MRRAALTDAFGRFRIWLAGPRDLVATKARFAAASMPHVAPGTDAVELVVTRSATLDVRLEPPAQIYPEAFELRRIDGKRPIVATLHAWTTSMGNQKPGTGVFEIVLRDDPSRPLVHRTVNLAPGGSSRLDADLRSCGLVRFRVIASNGNAVLGARVTLAGNDRVFTPNSAGTTRIAIATPDVSVTIVAPGFASIEGSYAQGTHDIVLRRVP